MRAACACTLPSFAPACLPCRADSRSPLSCRVVLLKFIAVCACLACIPTILRCFAHACFVADHAGGLHVAMMLVRARPVLRLQLGTRGGSGRDCIKNRIKKAYPKCASPYQYILPPPMSHLVRNRLERVEILISSPRSHSSPLPSSPACTLHSPSFLSLKRWWWWRKRGGARREVLFNLVSLTREAIRHCHKEGLSQGGMRSSCNATNTASSPARIYAASHDEGPATTKFVL